MCGRFTLSKPEKIQKRFNTANKLPIFEPSYNISPSQTLPVITRNSPNKIIMMHWGFTPEWGKEKGFSLINIRKETTQEKAYFKKILLNQRCLIPADGFYEWRTVNLEGQDEKYPFYVFLKERKLFGFAGLYSKLEDAEGKAYYTFAILTCPPNKVVAEIHHRMPVILEKSDENIWLDPKNKDFDNLYELLKPYSEEQITIYPVSKRVNNPKNDDQGLIEEFRETKLF
ncbi:hypothetical protein A2Z22_01265 [Candidatus Woesebacteria bacterium RBG_16_34_12]|uniref:Abasic site processing protein n=1 Tax=Candidatus Woesebacteria bacterium RBG_16_34_12 TaxID=1802480 RepID=A0A1F7XAL4_9BACT|nr:MAG: hypothetical protein A2Z22_01265 [Candidatus Woesebacteria bacterium RBG_16_34_12]